MILSFSYSVKSQTHLVQNDTNFIFYDFIPDTVLNYNTATGFRDSLRIDINQDGILDFRFSYVPSSGGYYPYINNMTMNCRYHYFLLSDTISLNNPSVLWLSGSDFWNPLDFPDLYFGIKIINGVNNYFGWIRARSPLATMTIDKYAFCKIPNYPLHLGQTEIVGIQNINIPDSTNIYLANAGNNLIVQSGKIIKNITLTSTNGVVVASKYDINGVSANLNVTNITHGAYIVQVTFDDLSICTRQIVK